MTLSTDTLTQTRHQAGRPPRRAGSGGLVTYGVGVGLALAAALGAVALNGHSGYAPADGPASAYARPTPALDGQTLAAYVAAHEDGRLTGPR